VLPVPAFNVPWCRAASKLGIEEKGFEKPNWANENGNLGFKWFQTINCDLALQFETC
jgi:hypothetical protein